jgi:diguanylate cyclase (GGDEF)-like protein/PAS domain S-box-containing protein
MLIQNSTLAFRDLALQIFIAIAMLLLYIAEVVTSESTRLQLSLKASEARFRLLAESSRDIIVMLGLHGERLYVSPAITEVLGWQPQEVLAETFRDRVHPEDAQKLTQLLEDCAAGKPTRPLAYRSRTKGGEYHWLETNPRLYHDPLTGEPAGIVSILRDVAERKTAEEELSRAFRMVQNLASIDGLTGIANRRLFDETLEREWRRAVRDGRQLSLALLDVDHFKLYNDLYGHLSGDDCLRQIAESIRNVVTRAADLAARYGGEEFALILPNTDRNGALKICNEILAAVRKRNIVHNANPHAVVTVSAGCVTCIARDDSNYRVALEAADAALYRAKALGRNRVEVAHSAGGSCGDPPSPQLPPASAVSS